MDFCDCLTVRGARDALRDVWDEMVEWAEEPSLDEVSDVMFGIGRFLGGLAGRVYVRMPGDRRHVAKITARMRSQGCVRSERKVAAGIGCR